MAYDMLFVNICLWAKDEKSLAVQNSYIGTQILASCLEGKAYSSKIMIRDPFNLKTILKQEIEKSKIKVVGLYCDYENQWHVNKISQYIRQSFSIPVIIGGPQAFCLDEQFIKESLCSAVICGEAEIALLQYLDCCLKKKGTLKEIRGIKYLNNQGNLIVQEQGELVNDLDTLPFPNAEHILGAETQRGRINILTGRGCPYSCSFCYEGHNTSSVRHRSVDNVIKEIEIFLNKQKGPSYILFVDDTFTLNYKRVLDFCNRLKELKTKHDFVWYCEAHVQTILKHPRMIPQMIEAGLVRLQLGIESGSQKILDAFNKKVTLKEIEDVINLCLQHGISQITGNIILGGAFESKKTIAQSKSFIEKTLTIGKGVLDLSVVFFRPFPNTAITNQPDNFGITVFDRHSLYSMTMEDYPTTFTKNMAAQDVVDSRQELMAHIDTIMKKTLFQVPFDTLKTQFRLYLNYGIESKWIYFINRHYAYIQLYFIYLLKREGFTLRYSSNEKLLEFYPLRTIQLLTLSSEGIPQLDFKILSHCSGKLTIREIVNTVYPQSRELLQDLGEKSFIANSFLEDDKEFFQTIVIAVLKRFEKKYWISFAEL